jgi:hypothetical protein
MPVGADGDGPMDIGAKHQGITLPIALNDGRVWMAKMTITLCRKHCDLRIIGGDGGLKGHVA